MADGHRAVWLSIAGHFAQGMARAQGARCEIHLTTLLEEAIAGTQYVSTQLRGGGMEARKNDEYLGHRHGLIGQETTGMGGMTKALRTIPAMLKIAEVLRASAPGALLVNFTNPSGLVTQALSQYAPDLSTARVCNGPFWGKMEIVDNLNRYGGYAIEASPGSPRCPGPQPPLLVPGSGVRGLRVLARGAGGLSRTRAG
jgi:6-phospho-beta-glucosidase